MLETAKLDLQQTALMSVSAVIGLRPVTTPSSQAKSLPRPVRNGGELSKH